MGIDFPSSLSASVGQKFTYSGQEYEFNGTAWKKSRDKVVSFNGATGAIVGVTSVQGKTGDVTLTDLEITHGVETFNGLSGSIDTTSLTLPVAGLSGVGGITFSDGTFQPTAARSGFRYKSISSGSGLGTSSTGTIDIDNVGEVDKIQINMTDKEGNNLAPLFQQLKDNGGYLEIMTGDFSQALVLTIESQKDDDNTISMGETTVVPGDPISTVQTTSLIEQGLDLQNIEDIYMRVIPNSSNFIREFNGITGSVDTTSLVLPVAGISASGDITTSGISCGGTAEANNFVVDAGKIFQKGNETTTHIDMSSAQDVTIKAADDIFIQSSDDISLTPADKLNIAHGTDAADGVVFTAGTVRLKNSSGSFMEIADDFSTVKIGDIGTVSSNSKFDITDGGIIVTAPNGSQAEKFDNNYRRNTDVATFTISASSAIATGKKTDSLYRLPYNATLKNVDVKVSATGGFTAGMFIAGSDFGLPATGSLTGATLGVSGLTASSTSFDVTTLTGGNYLFFDVINNDSGSTQAQMFVTFESR